MEEKNCSDCKYFAQYFIMKDKSIAKAACGHCKNIPKNGRLRSTDKPCAEFAHKKETKKDRTKSICSVIEKMSKTLDDLLQILQEINKW